MDEQPKQQEPEAREQAAAPADAATDATLAPELTLSEEELEALCKSHVCPRCAVATEAEDVKLRALAEGENLKKRLLRESEECRKFAADGVLFDLLPVLDNLELALAHASAQEACKDFAAGVELTRKLFLETLKRHGLEPTGAVGQAFDPAVHEALGVAADPNLAEDQVARLVQSGYVLKGRLLRPAKVLVNKLA
jgi:molecular chaperone GrpE